MGQQTSTADSAAYFYNQSQIIPNKTKREKKKLDDKALNTLNKKMSSKFQTDIYDPDGLNTGKSLAARLAELTSTNSFSMNSTRDSANTGSQGGGPNSFTDTRLQAIKYLTEDMIKELEIELLYYIETEQQPVLPGPIIYDWHSDWTDLTEKVIKSTFPIWQTKHGRDAHLKKSTELGIFF